MIKKKFGSKNYRLELKKKKLTKKFIRKLFLYKKLVRRSEKRRKLFFIKGKLTIRKLRKKSFVWKKRKKRKKLRQRHNFIFFFTKKKKRWPRISRRWFVFQYKVLQKSPIAVSKLFNKYIRDIKFRYRSRLKNKVLKKRALKKKLKDHYFFNVNGFKKLDFLIKKKKKFKIWKLFFLLEFRLATVCLRFHFFWNLKKAYYWVSKGVISVNNIRIQSINYNVNVNDFIRVIGPQILWHNKLVKLWGLKNLHIKFYYSFNYSELLYFISSGIILKIPTQINEIKTVFRRKRKSWLSLKPFSYIINSFY